jgi:hypothetical protein
MSSASASTIRKVINHHIGVTLGGKWEGQVGKCPAIYFLLKNSFFHLVGGGKENWLSVGKRGVRILSNGSNQFFPCF